VAPQLGKSAERFIQHLASANQDAHPVLIRLVLTLAIGAGKTIVMTMKIAWQTVNAVRRPRRCTTPSGTCSMWPARGREIGYGSRGSNRCRSF
jgi:hypothetical protein